MTATASSGVRRTINVDGASISYMRGGNGSPVLFLHGAGGAESWTPWMEALAATHDVIVPEHPGYGHSDTPDWFDTIHDLAYYYLDFMDALGLANVHLVGNAIGGWVGAEIAVRNTKHLADLTLIAPAGLRVKGIKRFDIFLASHEAHTRALFFDQSLADARLAKPLEGDRIDTHLKNSYATARLGWQPRLYDPHLTKWLHRIDIPTLLVWGEQDRIFPVAMMDEWLRLVPGSQGTAIPNCGHLPHVECSAAFIERFEAFVNGVRA